MRQHQSPHYFAQPRQFFARRAAAPAWTSTGPRKKKLIRRPHSLRRQFRAVSFFEGEAEAAEGIAKDSREQASAIEEVNAAVRQMDEMTQHNAALVEQTNAAIEQTEAQAVELDRIVDIFTLDDKVRMEAASMQRGVRGLQVQAKAAAKSYLSHGNAAVEEEWAEF